MISQKLDDALFETGCYSYIDCFKDDHNCNMDDVPLMFLVESVETHLDNLACYDYHDDYMKNEIKACKRFLKMAKGKKP